MTQPRLFLLLIASSLLFSGTAGLAVGATQSSTEGGISSGGGGTLPSEPPIDEYVFLNVIKDAKREIRLYILNRQNAGFRPDDWRAEFFQKSKNLGTILEEIDLQVKNDGPCLDKNGLPSDGSVYSSRPGAICISAYRIVPKLSKARAHAEIEALILHELSHLLGASESQAITLQTEMVDALANQNHQFPFQLWDLANSIQNSLDTLELTNHEITWKYWLRFSNVVGQINDFSGIAYDPVFARKRGFQTSYVFFNRLRIDLASSFVQSRIPQSELPGDNQKRSKAFYDSVFQGKDAVTVREILKNPKFSYYQDIAVEEIFGDEVITKMKSADDIIPLLVDLRQYFTDQKTLAISLQYDYALVSMTGPWNKHEFNPWRHFIGNYRVLKITCDSPDGKVPKGFNWTKIDVLENSAKPNEIRLRTFRDNNDVAVEKYFRNADGFAIDTRGDSQSAQLIDGVDHCWANCSSGRYKKTEISNYHGLLLFRARYQVRATNSDLGDTPTPLTGVDCSYELQR